MKDWVQFYRLALATSAVFIATANTMADTVVGNSMPMPDPGLPVLINSMQPPPQYVVAPVPWQVQQQQKDEMAMSCYGSYRSWCLSQFGFFDPTFLGMPILTFQQSSQVLFNCYDYGYAMCGMNQTLYQTYMQRLENALPAPSPMP